MTISITADEYVIPVTYFTFADGSVTLGLDIPAGFKPKRTVTITIEPHTPVNSYITEIALAKHAVQVAWEIYATSKPEYTLKLNLPYLPYSDRSIKSFKLVHPLPLWVFFNIIKDWFGEILLTDPHSDYIQQTFPAYGWMITVYPQHRCVIDTVSHFQDGDICVATSTTALTKLRSLQVALKVGGTKIEIRTATYIEDLPPTIILEDGVYTDKRCIIVNDIADTSTSFIPVAEALRNAGAIGVELYVTHGIFADGLVKLKGLIAAIHVYQIIGGYISKKDITDFNTTV